MRKILTGLAILALVYNGASAGLFGDDVDLADLSQLSPEALETFKDKEFNVFLMKVKHSGAKVLENKAKNDLKTSKLTLDAKQQHFKSAEADLKEAKAAQDSTRIDAAEKVLRNANIELAHAKLLIQWKEKEVDVQAASVEKAKLAVALAEAERDVARVSKLIEQNVPSAQKYNLSDFKTKLDKKHKEYQKALGTETKEIVEAKKLKAEYEKLSTQ
ncbi:MAG: hypothetical protein JSV31_02335 [Desulfobacterales bacterium]|nr:MAG: hypothetical protein JSV31_02335 [Desulfobacterales bacterium]